MKTLECSDCQMDIKHSKCSPLWKIAKEEEERDIKKKMYICDPQECIFEDACRIISWSTQ